MFICNVCSKECTSRRSFTMHLNHSPYCDANHFSKQADIFVDDNNSPIDFIESNDNTSINSYSSHIDEKDDCLIDSKYDYSLLKMKKDYLESPYNQVLNNQNVFDAQLDLIHILDSTNTPLYLFDQLVNWINKYVVYNDIFMHSLSSKSILSSREQTMTIIKNRTNMKLIEPFTKNIYLPGSKLSIDIVLHDFKSSLYTLLMDESLMKDENLLINDSKLGKQNHLLLKSKIINDIDTGNAYKIGMKKYLSDNETDVLLPIIFFIDKTHTDVNGRLCLEQVRFTLGIFNRETRNNEQAWRTLGYINDQQHRTNSYEKSKDYHFMLKTILCSFVEVQNASLSWKIKKSNDSGTYDVVFKPAVLFIIGDTEGHDKLCGKYTNRSANVKRLCRYCDTPYNETDNTEYDFTHNRCDKINSLIDKATSSNSFKRKTEAIQHLKNMSFHPVVNAWDDVNFCDYQRGIFGATPAKVMHCLQHGLFMCLFKGLFDQRKLKKNGKKRVLKSVGNKMNSKGTKRVKNNTSSVINNHNMNYLEDSSDEEDNRQGNHSEYFHSSNEFGNLKLFSESYAKRFDSLSKQYGKLLSWQSDRDLPRTYFNSNYTLITRKNANEMVGLLIVYLIMFASEEGLNIDKELGEKTTAEYIHLIELMLMMDNFCKFNEHKRCNVILFRKFVPRILEKFKEVVNRREGNGMKITKFHLPLHFADDIIRFGSMSNYDSGICEAHHKSAAKRPSSNTQRRQSNFEIQTARRQIDSLSINVAHQQTFNINSENNNSNEISNHTYKIKFCEKRRILISRNQQNSKWDIVNFVDTLFYNQLIVFCEKMIEEGYLLAPLFFFTRHKRFGTTFKADPIYKEKECWYDWATVKWDVESLPAKLLIFLDISAESFLKPFTVGSTSIFGSGSYALCYTMEYHTKIKAHTTSALVSYGEITMNKNNTEPTLCMFLLDAIESTISAVPFKIDNTVNKINSKEWLFLYSKAEWYDLFIDFMEENDE